MQKRTSLQIEPGIILNDGNYVGLADERAYTGLELREGMNEIASLREERDRLVEENEKLLEHNQRLVSIVALIPVKDQGGYSTESLRQFQLMQEQQRDEYIRQLRESVKKLNEDRNRCMKIGMESHIRCNKLEADRDRLQGALGVQHLRTRIGSL